MRRTGRSWGGLMMVGLAVVGLHARPAAAQEQQKQAADSTKARAERLLKRFARSPAADSLLYIQDSIAKAQLTKNRPAAGTGTARGDSVLAELVKMPGYVLTQYKGTEASYDAQDHVLVLHGQGRKNPTTVSREGTEVQADSSIVYYEDKDRMLARGSPIVTPPQGQGSPLSSRTLVFNTSKGYGTAEGAKTTYQQQSGSGGKWIVSGDMPLAARDSDFISPGIFTSCDINPPHYHFETNQIKIVAGKVLVARPVKLYFADVPVAWLPFMAQSLSHGRASGLLTPLFSLNDIVRTSSGYHRRVSNIGFYWAMSQYSDASAALDWFSGKWLALTGDFRYKVTRQFLSGNLDVRRYWLDNGSRQLSLSTSQSWQPDERTQVRVSGQYASSTSFVQQNTFDPQEAIQSINSQGGINRRFDWGNLTLSANRRQYLSDGRTDWTLPSVSLSLSPITLFTAAPSDAHFWNNMTWSGSASATRETVSRVQPDTFSVAQASTDTRQASVSSNLSMGNLTWSQQAQVQENTLRNVPDAFIASGSAAPVDSLLRGMPTRNATDATLNWSTSLGYQQHLIGSTTITPSVSISGQMFRSDTSALAPHFVSAPNRMNFGVGLQTDIYGFYPGFGSYTAVRHKLSPSFSFSWSPQVTPTPLQTEIFHTQGSGELETLAVTLQQTFEAKGKAPADTTAKDTASTAGGPRVPPRAPITTLLALSTSVVNYDFIQARSLGFPLAGFTTTQLQNQVSSDFLRGLSLSFTHDLFKDKTDPTTGKLVSRTFSPHLSQLNLSFQLGSQSRIFRWLDFFRHGKASSDTTQAAEPAEDTTALGSAALTSQSSVIPTQRRARPPLMGGATGGWRAQISYALQRPRANPSLTTQMLQLSLSMKPTANWDMTWRTSYDVQHGRFDSHMVSLTRDLHRWRANFDFFQTPSGNWTFRFQVSLIDNRDLKFNYSQNSTDFVQ